MKRIASDLIAKKVTLDEIWDNKAKRKYLNKLDEEGVLPSVEDALPESKPVTKKASKTPDKKSPKKSSPPERRVRLIRNIDHGIQPSRANRKALDIFDELQHRLKFGDHDNAIAVLFRVLLEISIDIYIHEKSLTTAHKNDKLASKFRKVLDDLVATGELDKKQASSLKSFEKSEALFSANTLHAYIHSAEYFPSDHHLKGMWDTLETFVVKCLQPSA
ncbi:MAG TPA: hypothetical protein EYG57_09300 [Planctomycetes bacterium]|nr:hypothetical protein [Planctomycetota bacterium]